MSEPVLEHCWVDVQNRKFQILSRDGEVREIECVDGRTGINQFLRVLMEIRAQVPEDDVTYTDYEDAFSNR